MASNDRRYSADVEHNLQLATLSYHNLDFYRDHIYHVLLCTAAERGFLNNFYGAAVILRLLRRDIGVSCPEDDIDSMGLRDRQESGLKNRHHRS